MASANSTSSRTSKRNAGPAKPRSTGMSEDLPGEVRLLAQDIESRVCDIEILLETIFEKIDRLASAGPVKTLDAINTLTTCALRNVALIKEHYEHISALTIGGGQ